MTVTSTIESRALTRHFGANVAVDRIDLSIAAGSVTGILGPNGAGKSTFLRMLVGLVPPTSGTATVVGIELKGDGTAVRRQVAFAPGEIAMYGEMRASEQLDWLLRGRTKKAFERGRDMAERLSLPLEKRIHEYSHGMKRQLLFAAAMAPLVKLRILDEPTEGLDPAKRRSVLEMIAEDAKAGVTILLSSHHLSEVEEVCERLVFFEGGRILADEDPVELRRLAARCARLEYEDEAQAAAAAAQLQSHAAVTKASANRNEVRIEFAKNASPFEHLAAIENAVNPPIALEFGRLSLEDLYERIYGVRGL